VRRAFIGAVALSLLLLSACNLVLGMDALDSGGPDRGGAPTSGAGGFTSSGGGGQAGGGNAGGATEGGNAGSATEGGNSGSATEGGNSGSAGQAGAGGNTGVPYSGGGRGGNGGNGGFADVGGSGGSSGIGAPCSTKSPDASCSCVGYATHDYWFCSAYLTFEAAEKKCKAVSMHLPRVETQAEDTFLFNTGADKNMGEYFLGAIDAQYSHWSTGQPDGSGDCTVVQINGPWDDRTCFDQRKYICEAVRAH
jgi:hypothetical protein